MKPATALSPNRRSNTDPGRHLPSLQEPSRFRNRVAPPETGTYAEYARIVSRWWLAIVGCAMAGAVLSLSLTLPVLPVFQARTSLNIENINGDFLDMKNVATSDNGSSSSEAYVETQIKLLQSRTVLDQTVARMKARPLPALDRDDLVSKWKRSLHLSNGKDLPFATVLEDTAKRVTIKPMGKTRIVEITCASWDAKFAADFCNELTKQFKAIDLETRSSEAAKTSEFLTRQVADVREKAEQSEKKLELATGGDALSLSKESNSLGEDHLRELEGEIVRAQADRLQRESELQIATRVGSVSTSVSDSPADREYEQMIAVLNEKIAELMPPLTEQHPKIIHLRSEIKAVQNAMDEEHGKALDKLRNKFDAARSYESRLNGVYATAQASVSNEMSKTERVDLLRREVDSETQLYQTLLQRAKEAGFASAMETTTMRIVDAAAVPKVPISPSRVTATMSGLALGCLCGVGFAFFKHRTMKVFLAPGDSERFLNVYELGAIPSVSFVRSRSFYSVLRLKSANTAAVQQPPPGLVAWKETVSVVTEAFRNVTHSILLSGPLIRKPRIYTVVSPNSGEGKSTVTANLGVSFSKSKMKVVVVDADMRKPSQHKNLGVDNDCGLRNVLREEFDVSAVPLEMFCKQSAIPNLWVVAAGEGNEQPVELLQSKAVAALLKRLTSEFDLVFIDTPPMLHMADARILSAQADGVVVVFRAGVTDRSDAADVCARIENDNITMVGTILNDFDAGREGKRGYYSSYFKYMNSVNAARTAV